LISFGPGRVIFHSLRSKTVEGAWAKTRGSPKSKAPANAAVKKRAERREGINFGLFADIAPASSRASPDEASAVKNRAGSSVIRHWYRQDS
jgi:hypothetical protein